MNRYLSAPLNRRSFLRIGGYATLARNTALIPNGSPPKAILFDAFPIFDPRAVQHRVESVVAEKSVALYELWRTKLFESQWIRALTGRYSDFEHTVQESLAFAARSVGVVLTSAAQSELRAAFWNLPAWPDAEGALQTLTGLGAKVGFLSNMTEAMLRANLRNVRLEKYFDVVLSTDKVRSFKPDPRAYELACTELGLARHEVLFVSFAGWDAAGATWFGFPTFWVNRARAVNEFEASVEGEGPGLDDLVRFANRRFGNQADA